MWYKFRGQVRGTPTPLKTLILMVRTEKLGHTLLHEL